MSMEQWLNGDWQGECYNVLSGQDYRRVWSKGGMVTGRGM